MMRVIYRRYVTSIIVLRQRGKQDGAEDDDRGAAENLKIFRSIIKELEGNRGHHPPRLKEPKPESGIPTRPEWLDPEAKREWGRVCAALDEIGMIAKVDRAALAGYCQSWADYVACVKAVQEEGRTFLNDKGNPATRPEVAQAQQHIRAMRAFCSDFGLTPSARGRMTLPGQIEEEDPLDKILGLN
jgi:P27 family predicted phage terminase small subunit